MKRSLISWLTVALLSVPAPGLAKEVVGWIEQVRVYPGGVLVEAKVDTGAQTSSVDCQCITPLEKNGKKYVSFTVQDVNGEFTRLEKPVVRVTRIKQHNGESQERYVVRLGLCLAGTYRVREVTLTDRANFKYPILIGRNFLGNDFLVDPSEKHLSNPRCQNAPPDE